MNWQHFIKQNLNKVVRLHPPARFFDATDVELPPLDDDWQISGFPEGNKVQLINCRTNSVVVVAKDAVYGYADDAHRTVDVKDGKAYGFVTLKLEVLIRNGIVSTRLNARPGEAVGNRIPPQWTKPIGVSLDDFIPSAAPSATLQYKLWSDDSRIELMIRVSQAGGVAPREYSGAAGVIEWQFSGDRNIYISFSHPRIMFEIGALGYQVNNGAK